MIIYIHPSNFFESRLAQRKVDKGNPSDDTTTENNDVEANDNIGDATADSRDPRWTSTDMSHYWKRLLARCFGTTYLAIIFSMVLFIVSLLLYGLSFLFADKTVKRKKLRPKQLVFAREAITF